MKNKINVVVSHATPVGEQVAYPVGSPENFDSDFELPLIKAFLKPDDVLPNRYPEIEGGWDIERSRFEITMAVAGTRHPINAVYTVTGYSDRVITQGSGDAKLFFNRIIAKSYYEAATRSGTVTQSRTRANEHVLCGSPSLRKLRPSDVARRSSADSAFGEFMSAGATCKPMNMIGSFNSHQRVTLADSIRENPANYAVDFFIACQHSDSTNEFGYGQDHIFEEAALRLDENNIHCYPFFDVLLRSTMLGEDGYITLDELNDCFAADYEFTPRLRFNSTAPARGGDQSLTSYVANFIYQILLVDMYVLNINHVRLVGELFDKSLALTYSAGSDTGSRDGECVMSGRRLLGLEAMRSMAEGCGVDSVNLSIYATRDDVVTITISINGGDKVTYAKPAWASGALSGQIVEGEQQYEKISTFIREATNRRLTIQ